MTRHLVPVPYNSLDFEDASTINGFNKSPSSVLSPSIHDDEEIIHQRAVLVPQPSNDNATVEPRRARPFAAPKWKYLTPVLAYIICLLGMMIACNIFHHALTSSNPSPAINKQWTPSVFNFNKVTPSVPWPGHVFIIRHSSTGELLALRGNDIVLTSPGGEVGDLMQWECTEKKGWLGFRNAGSKTFLGHDIFGKLRCSAETQYEWENFSARAVLGGKGYVLLMTHFGRLLHVGVGKDGQLAKLGDGALGDGAVAWEFIRVQ